MAYRTTPKMVKRKEAHRARFLQTAIRLFGKQGYHATTVPRIVRESGSSTGAFYFYFRNKDDIFARALEANELGAEIVPHLVFETQLIHQSGVARLPGQKRAGIDGGADIWRFG